MSENTTTSNTPAAAPDVTVKQWTVNGKPLTVQTGTIKAGDNKGRPTFRILTAGAIGKAPTAAQIITVLATLNIADAVAPLIDKEIIQDLCKEVASRARVQDAAGVWSFNEGKIGEAFVTVVKEYAEQKAGKDALRGELAELQQKQADIMKKLTTAIAEGKDLRAAEFKPITNEASQVALKISEINSRLAAAANKKAKAKSAAPAVVTATA